jgi:hypothetical protein
MTERFDTRYRKPFSEHERKKITRKIEKCVLGYHRESFFADKIDSRVYEVGKSVPDGRLFAKSRYFSVFTL